jgi:hypothetical protein
MKMTIENLGADEKCVLQFLNHWPETYVSGTEIARQADGKSRFVEDPRWANLALAQLVEWNLVESETGGEYRVKGRADAKRIGRRRFIAPHLRAILKKSGRQFHGLPV